jgi:hypothetical protein
MNQLPPSVKYDEFIACAKGCLPKEESHYCLFGLQSPESQGAESPFPYWAPMMA